MNLGLGTKEAIDVRLSLRSGVFFLLECFFRSESRGKAQRGKEKYA